MHLHAPPQHHLSQHHNFLQMDVIPSITIISSHPVRQLCPDPTPVCQGACHTNHLNGRIPTCWVLVPLTIGALETAVGLTAVFDQGKILGWTAIRAHLRRTYQLTKPGFWSLEKWGKWKQWRKLGKTGGGGMEKNGGGVGGNEGKWGDMRGEMGQ